MDNLDTESINELQNAGKFEVVTAVENSSKTTAIKLVLERNVKFDFDELDQLFSVFEQFADSDFFVNQEKFNGLILDYIPWLEWRRELIPILFDFATSQSPCRTSVPTGSIDFLQFVLLASSIYKSSLRDKLAFYFKLHDGDGDGLLDKGDYYRTLDVLIRYLPLFFIISSSYLFLLNFHVT